MSFEAAGVEAIGRSFPNTFVQAPLLTGESQIPDTLQTAWSIGYGYNSLGQLVSETDPGSVTVNYTVNAFGQATGLTASVNGGAATPLASNASYYANGALKQFTYGNGIVHTMTQNARQLPSRSTDGTVLDLATAFDANGNVTSVTDYTSNAHQSRTLGYDGLDRLTGVSSPMFGTVAYRYDTADNLTRVWIDGGNQPRDHTYCYNTTTNRLDFVRNGTNCASSPAAITLAYDVQGNLSGKNGTAYAFDYGNRLRSTAGLTYRYDADGRRVRQDSAGSQLKYSYYAKDGRLVWQRDEPAGKRINNVYFAGSLLSEISRPIGTDTATFSYFHTDALGSPIAKTNSAGTVTETSEYEPYGKLVNRANDDRAGYTGHVMDSASGLTYMQQRYCDPGIGRCLSVDPVTAYGNGDMRFFNRYAYAFNNPYRFTDPDGRQSRDFDSISKEAGTYLKTPPRSEKDWLGPTIGVALVVISAPAAGYGIYELGMTALANPVATTAIVSEVGAAAGVTGTANTLKPGPFAAESIPARSTAQTFTSGERAAINKIGQATGCHTCGTTSPGTKTGNFVPDHQPVSSLNKTNAPQQLYPQCLTCSRQQGLDAARELRKKEP